MLFEGTNWWLFFINVTTELSLSNLICNIFLYPTPSKGVLNSNTDEQLEKIEVYNYIGQRVLESKQLQINTSQLNSGIYLLKVYGINGEIGVKRFIKQ